MIAEDIEVTITIKQSSKTYPELKGADQKQCEETNSLNQSTKEEQLRYPVCKSSWITHMMSTDQQMYNSVRDYVVNSERIGSLLKEHQRKIKVVSGDQYLIRIRTKWPRHAICANTTVM